MTGLPEDLVQVMVEMGTAADTVQLSVALSPSLTTRGKRELGVIVTSTGETGPEESEEEQTP